MSRRRCAAISGAMAAIGLVLTITEGLVLPVQANWQPSLPLTATGTESVTGLNHTPMVYDAAGGLHMVWAERDTPGQNFQIYARHRPWAEWSAAELVVPYPDPQPGSLLGAKYPSLAAVGDSLYMTWHDYRIGGIYNAEIYVRAGAREGGWSDELRITTTANTANPGDNGLVPTVAVTGGVVHIVWYDFRWAPTMADLFHARREPAGWVTALGDTTDINLSQGVSAGWDAGPPAVAAGAAGVVHVAWADQRLGESRLRHARFVPGAGWTTPETVAESGNPVEAPTGALTADGTLHLVWVETVAGGKALVTRSRSPVGVWAMPLILTDPAQLAAEPSLLADAAGDLHLVWQDAREGLVNREIFHRRRSAGMAWDTSGATDERISVAPGRADHPSIAADLAGNLAVLWRDQRSGVAELWLREFRPAGPIAVHLDPAREGSPGPAGLPLVRGPNPFHGVLQLAGPAREPVAIISILGRQVTTLSPAARHWDGRTARGERAAAGVYLLRGLRSGRLARVVLLP